MVIFSCSAFGYSKSLVLSGRLRQLREIEKMVFLIRGIAYRKKGFSGGAVRIAVKLRIPFPVF